MIRLRLENLSRASNRYRHNIRLGLRGKHKSSTLERFDCAVTTCGSFGEDHHRSGLANRLRRLCQRSDGGARICAIDGYMPGPAKMPAEKRNPEQFLLRRETELNRHRDDNDRYI